MLFFERDIAIDLGTTTTLVYVRGKGVAMREPTVVAVDKNTGKLLKVGEDARKMLGRTPANIAGAYRVPDPAAVIGKRVLLIDDIVTTGSTLSECARTLRAAGAAGVVCAALASTPPREP